jgi:hypothetical protein
MKKFLSWLFIVNCSLLINTPVFASYISLNTTLRTKVAGDTLQVIVQSVNKGDESAFAVQAEFRVGGKTILAEKTAELPVNATYQAAVSLPLKLKTPGNYPLLLVLHYADANQYPFSALTAHSFVYRQEGVPPFLGQVKPAAFEKAGTVHFVLKNSGDRAIAARTRLIVPSELTVENDQAALTLAPRAQQSVDFRLSNFSALAGSTYQLFAVTEFENNGLHYTSLTPGLVRITADRTLFGLSQNSLVICLISLVALFIGGQFIKRGR